MNSWALAACAAATISASLASRRPYFRFSPIVREKRMLSCITTPIWRRTDWVLQPTMSVPSIVMRPVSGS